jgi:hypothetical protein
MKSWVTLFGVMLKIERSEGRDSFLFNESFLFKEKSSANGLKISVESFLPTLGQEFLVKKL